MCVFTGKRMRESSCNKVFLSGFSVLSKFYEKMDKRPGEKSENLISAQGAYS